MKPNPIDYEYFEWLTSQIFVNPGKSFDELFELMHNTEFVWFVPNDDNRVQDGMALRHEFLDSRRQKLKLPYVTFLEVLIGLSRQTSFIVGGEDAKRWAWRLIKNIGLNRMSDPLTDIRKTQAAELIEDVIWRNYEPDGKGGFFPLKNAKQNLTEVELWGQLQLYSIELHGL